MRIAAIGASLLLAFAACSTTDSSSSPYQQPNSLMAGEITRRMQEIPYQHREELLENLMWLAQTGEQTIPALLEGLRSDNAKVRSSAAWVLGRLRDHRTIPNLQAAMKDSDQTVRMEVARTLVLLGDLVWAPNLIEGLDSDKKEVRYMCHEALKIATGHDFGYDHLNQDQSQMRVSVLRWRQWWSEYSGDVFFAQSYQQKYNLSAQVAAPMGESKPMQAPVVAPMPTPDSIDAMNTDANDIDAPMPPKTDSPKGTDKGAAGNVDQASEPMPRPNRKG